jgi:hypothetical protein
MAPGGRHQARLLVLFLLALALLGAGGCSLLLDFDEEPVQVDASLPDTPVTGSF